MITLLGTGLLGAAMGERLLRCGRRSRRGVAGKRCLIVVAEEEA